jgi:hypothetical protein
MPIPLSESQFLAIANAALALCPGDRDRFWMEVAVELKGKPIGDGSVGCAIRAVQARFPHPNTGHAPHSSWRNKKNPHEQGQKEFHNAA